MSQRILWFLPPLLGMLIYWPGLLAWFQQDDFAWLGLLRDVREGGSIWDAVFKPSQHGTWRPLGERAFFLFFPWVFGYESWPMRAVAILTQMASLTVLQAITWRITKSRLAAVLAPILWIANSKLTIAMISNGAYIHILCGFCLLFAFYCLLREWYIAMWIVFILGFGAMESNVVFPALVTVYCLLFDRTKMKHVIWLWPVSILYFIGHMLLAPKMAGGTYSMHFDFGIFKTLATYWMWIFTPENVEAFTKIPERYTTIIGVIITLCVAGAVIHAAIRKEFTGLFFVACFVIFLAPVLPLSNHVTDYYLTIPLAAFGMLAGWMGARWRWTLPLLAIYLAISISCAYQGTSWWQKRGDVAKVLVKRVFAVHQANPGKIILLNDVTDEQFWAAIAHYPFVEHKKTYVFLAEGTASRIQAHPESGVRMEEFSLPKDIAEADVVRFSARNP